jgi:adenylate cyclase
MADLIAQGARPEHNWRRPLPTDQPVVIGRDAPPWSTAWDDFISRRHATLTWCNGELEVQKLPASRNPIYVKGEPTAHFRLKAGGRFVIGETTFTVVDDAQLVSRPRSREVKKRNFTATELKQLQVRDAARQIDILSHLPAVVSKAADERELFVGLVNLLLAGIKQATAAALVAVEEVPGNVEPVVRVLAWERQQATATSFQPSSRLIVEALSQQETVLHVWADAESSSNSCGNTYTQDASVDWAFCTPLRSEVSKGWGIYLTGTFGGDQANSILAERDPAALVDDLKFTELVAAIWSSLQLVNVLKHRQASLSQFFSPTVLATLSNADPDVVLKPRKTEVTVLFCDLRGFSREAEKRELLALLEGVSKALGVMTQHILKAGGVIGDFHGDAAMGFWGWPMSQPDAVQRACLAALEIRLRFEEMAGQAEQALANFRVGIGIATGPAVAGKIGTVDQVKVTVFGPVVNLASRLEGMTKILGVPILLDENTATLARQQLQPGQARVRRLARVRPYGMETASWVSELLPPVARQPLLTDAHLADFEAAVDALLGGMWPRALELLHRLPPTDQGKDFLTEFIIRNKRTPPADWDGVIEMSSKT